MVDDLLFRNKLYTLRKIVIPFWCRMGYVGGEWGVGCVGVAWDVWVENGVGWKVGG